MEVFNVIQCILLMSICCEGKSELAEIKCQSEIMNMTTALKLYKNSARMWQFKSALLTYISHCYLDSGNRNLFLTNYYQYNAQHLKEMLLSISDDINLIFDEWHMNESDIRIILPDLS
jgi:hypothetical protein